MAKEPKPTPPEGRPIDDDDMPSRHDDPSSPPIHDPRPSQGGKPAPVRDKRRSPLDN